MSQGCITELQKHIALRKTKVVYNFGLSECNSIELIKVIISSVSIFITLTVSYT